MNDLIPLGQKYFSALRLLDAAFDDGLGQRIARLQGLAPRKLALKVILQMSRSLLSSMVAESRARAYMGYSVLARSLWEHFVDFETLRRSEGDADGARFHAFSTIQIWNRAVRANRVRENHGIESPYAQIVSDGSRREELDAVIARHWPDHSAESVNRIGSWDGNSIAGRAAALGPKMEIEYRETYSMLSWSAHPNAAGVVNLNRADIEGFAGYAIAIFFEKLFAMTKKFLEEVDLLRDEEWRLAPIVELVN